MTHTSLETQQLMDSGDSRLELDRRIKDFDIEVTLNNEPHRIKFATNRAHRLSTALITLNATGSDHAHRLAFDLVTPFLSYLSFIYDVALDVSGYEIAEVSSSARMWSFVVTGKAKTLRPEAIRAAAIPEQQRPVLAAYREGMNATNVFHQVLCFYKVVQASQQLRRARTLSARTAGSTAMRPERFPDNIDDIPLDFLAHSKLFLPLLGKKFNAVLDDHRELLRNAYAHLDPERDDLSADSFDDVEACQKAIPVLRFIARQLLEEELECGIDPASEVPGPPSTL